MEALLAKLRLADAEPEACGVKVTVNGAEFPAAMVSGSEIPLSANSGLLTLADETVTLAAADNYRIAVRTLQLARPVGTDITIVVPARSYAELIRILPDIVKFV